MGTRAWFRLHSFTGVITGLLLFVVCWSGTVAVLAHELDWLATPAMRVEPGERFAGWSAIESAARAAVPGGRVGWIEAPRYENSAALVRVTTPDDGMVLVAVDPYRAEATATFQGSYTVHRFFRNFHRTLFLGSFGHYLVTALGFTLLLSLVAALYVYKRWWTRFFRFRPGRGRAFWSELHKTGGLWSLWFVLVIGVTSVWYFAEGIRADLGDGKVNYAGGDASYSVAVVPAPTSDPDLPPLSLDQLAAQVGLAWPDFSPRSIALDWLPDGVVYIDGQASFPLVRDRTHQMNLDPRTGEVLLAHRAVDLSPYWIWTNMADPLHFGDFAGLASKLVWFVFGLVLCGLIYTGTLLHARRLAGSASDRHRWPGTLAALATTLVVLAASVPAGWSDAIRYYGPAQGVPPTLEAGVIWVIGGWIVLTLALIGVWLRLLWRA